MPEFRPEDLEAFRQAVSHLAPLIARYMAGLIEGGLSRAEALELTRDWQRGLMSQARSASPQTWPPLKEKGTFLAKELERCPSCGKSPCAGPGTGCQRGR